MVLKFYPGLSNKLTHFCNDFYMLDLNNESNKEYLIDLYNSIIDSESKKRV
ncbi:hypothetical protein D3C76_1858250 [compost metagenome]